MANGGISRSALAKQTGHSWDKVNLCLKKAKFEKSRKARVNYQWKGPLITYGFAFELYMQECADC